MTGAKVPLERPALPAIEARLEAPSAVAVFGIGAQAFARALADALATRGRAATVVSTQLTHARGFDLVESNDGAAKGELQLYSDPSTLEEAMRHLFATDRGLVIGVGEAFAVAVRAPLTVWISGGASVVSLPSSLRTTAREARLVLESPRLETARALAERVAPND